MKVRVNEWGNNHGIRIPKSVLQEAGIQVDEKLTVVVENGQSFRHKTLEERIRESGRELTGIGEIDWGEPQGSEVW